jgi:hypothetical protein
VLIDDIRSWCIVALLARPTNGLPETLGKERQRLAKVKSKKLGISAFQSGSKQNVSRVNPAKNR